MSSQEQGEVDLLSAPTGTDLRSAPIGADLRSASTGADLRSAPSGADLHSAPSGATHTSRCQEAEFSKGRPRPCTPGYKNRNLVQSKLTDDLYRKAWVYCRDHGYSFSSFTRSLYESFFTES